MSDTHNPYAAPHAAVEPAYASDFDGDGPPAPWATGEVLSQSFELFKQHWAPLLGGLVIGYVIMFGAQMVSGAVVGALGGGSENVALVLASSLISLVVSMLVQAAVTCGWNRLFLMAARGETPDLGVLFSSFGLFPQMLIATVVVSLGYLLGFLLLVVPGVIFLLGTMLYSYFVVDGDSALDAIRKSWDATKGQKGALFVLLLAVMGINIVGMLACGLGLLVSAPVTFLALAIVYTRISGRFAPRS